MYDSSNEITFPKKGKRKFYDLLLMLYLGDVDLMMMRVLMLSPFWLGCP